jgi:hypothetical protein
MSYKDYFASRFLKVDDLKGRKVALTIGKAVGEEIGQGADKREKLVLYFNETAKGLVINRTNGDLIAEQVGTDDEQQWVGHRIVLVPAKTMFQNKRVACIRVEEPGEAVLPAEPADIFDSEFDEAGGAQ